MSVTSTSNVRAGIPELLSVAAAAVWADDRSDYNARAALRLVNLFQSLDRDADGLLTRDESNGDLDLGPRFDDMDINRDGSVTREELTVTSNVRARYEPDGQQMRGFYT